MDWFAAGKALSAAPTVPAAGAFPSMVSWPSDTLIGEPQPRAEDGEIENAPQTSRVPIRQDLDTPLRRDSCDVHSPVAVRERHCLPKIRRVRPIRP